jgi:plastocyanin
MGANLDENFRLWFLDHANHGDLSNPNAPTHVVSYVAVLHQALLDLSDWVEKGVAPAATTNYKVVDGQVVVPASANERKGIQPVVTLLANDGERAEVKPGQPITFKATIEVPPHAGKVIAAEWDFEGNGTFPVKDKLKSAQKSREQITLKATHVFSKAGTYFVTLKGVSQRQGDSTDPFTRIQNLARVRVVVE